MNFTSNIEINVLRERMDSLAWHHNLITETTTPTCDLTERSSLSSSISSVPLLPGGPLTTQSNESAISTRILNAISTSITAPAVYSRLHRDFLSKMERAIGGVGTELNDRTAELVAHAYRHCFVGHGMWGDGRKAGEGNISIAPLGRSLRVCVLERKREKSRLLTLDPP